MSAGQKDAEVDDGLDAGISNLSMGYTPTPPAVDDPTTENLILPDSLNFSGSWNTDTDTFPPSPIPSPPRPSTPNSDYEPVPTPTTLMPEGHSSNNVHPCSDTDPDSDAASQYTEFSELSADLLAPPCGQDACATYIQILDLRNRELVREYDGATGELEETRNELEELRKQYNWEIQQFNEWEVEKEAEITSLQRERNGLYGTIEEAAKLRKHLHDLENVIERINGEKKALKEKAGKYLNEVNGLEDQSLTDAFTIAGLRVNNDMLATAAGKHEGEITTLRAENEQLKQAAENSANLIAQLQVSNTSLEAVAARDSVRANKLEKGLNKADIMYKTLQHEVQDMVRVRHLLIDETKGLKKQLQEARQEKEVLEGKYSQAMKHAAIEKTSSLEKYERVVKDKEALSEKYYSVVVDRSRLQKEREDLAKNLRTVSSNHSIVLQELDEVTEQRDIAADQCKALSTHLDTIRANSIALTARNNELVQGAQTQHDNLTLEVQNARKEIDSLKQKCENEIRTIKDQHLAATEKLKEDHKFELRDQIVQIQRFIKQTLAERDSEIAALKAQVAKNLASVPSANCTNCAAMQARYEDTLLQKKMEYVSGLSMRERVIEEHTKKLRDSQDLVQNMGKQVESTSASILNLEERLSAKTSAYDISAGECIRLRKELEWFKREYRMCKVWEEKHQRKTICMREEIKGLQSELDMVGALLDRSEKVARAQGRYRVRERRRFEEKKEELERRVTACEAEAARMQNEMAQAGVGCKEKVVVFKDAFTRLVRAFREGAENCLEDVENDDAEDSDEDSDDSGESDSEKDSEYDSEYDSEDDSEYDSEDDSEDDSEISHDDSQDDSEGDSEYFSNDDSEDADPTVNSPSSRPPPLINESYSEPESSLRQPQFQYTSIRRRESDVERPSSSKNNA